jgi:FkbM family methyltransferase
MNLDFIEIGTSDFRTLFDVSNENTYGIAIEPCKFYLDNLPNFKNIIKLNCAISLNENIDPIDFYYIHPDIIEEKNLPDYLRGCNTIANYHPLHIKHNLKKYVSIEKVEQRTLSSILKEYKVKKLKFLKMDTEGGDCSILKYFYNHIIEYDFYPDKIQFENNITSQLTNQEEVKHIKNLYSKIGYSIHDLNKEKWDEDIILINRIKY